MSKGLAVVLVAAACGVTVPPPAEDVSLGAPTLDLADAARLSRRRAAMLSVHAYVEQRRPVLRDVLRNVTPMPLVEAARVLVADPSPLAPMRRHLAVVRLVAHGRDEPEAVAAVDVLLGSAEVRRRLFTWLDSRRAAESANENPEIAVAAGVDAVAGGLSGGSVQTSLGSCSSWSNAYSYVGRPSARYVSILMIAEAGQTLAVAREKLDPQSWDDCSTFWADTYLAQPGGGTPTPNPTPPPKGQPYTNERLYEDVQCDGHCSLELLLDVSTAVRSTRAQDDTYLVTFGSPTQLSGWPTIRADYGSIMATENGNTLSLRSVKTVGFDSSATADWVYAILLSIDLTAHLQRLACCQ